jgi:hypothetical protein
LLFSQNLVGSGVEEDQVCFNMCLCVCVAVYNELHHSFFISAL